MPIETPAQQFVPPYPQALVSGYTGFGQIGWGATGDDGSGASSQVPKSYDLEWVAGDTAVFDFFFANVCWTPTDPSPTQMPWEPVSWRSQVRTSHYYYYGYWWPPTFPLGAFLLEFACTAEYVEDDPINGSGTTVTIKGGTPWTGDFKWDLQSEHHVNVNDPSFYEARTWYQGKAKVLPQYTSPTIYAPSNWPMYSFVSNPWPPPPAQGPVFP